jgi:thymidylate kinase
MILTLEGASAVGKTTTAAALVDQFAAATFPEVNALFRRPPEDHPNWYFERQVDRWQMAKALDKDKAIVILDGDALQALWYNWIFQNSGFQPLDDVIAFYGPLIEQGQLGFPDCYVILLAPETELRRRKEKDATRSRRNFENHLKLVQAQVLYFEAMSALAPGRVHFVQATDTEASVNEIMRVTNGASPMAAALEPTSVFAAMADWLKGRLAP